MSEEKSASGETLAEVAPPDVIAGFTAKMRELADLIDAGADISIAIGYATGTELNGAFIGQVGSLCSISMLLDKRITAMIP